MKVLHFVRSSSKYYGSYYYFQKQIEGLHAYNIQTVIMCYEKSSSAVSAPLSDHIVYYDESNFAEQLQSIGPDIIHFHDIYPFYLIENNKYVTKASRLPRIYEFADHYVKVRTLHDYSSIICPHYFYYNDQEIRCQQPVNETCVNKNCISKSTYDMYMQYLKDLKGYNGLFYFSDNIKNALSTIGVDSHKCFQVPPLIKKPEHFAQPEENLIVFSGRLAQEKGLLYLLKALTRIKDENWKLIAAGMDNLAYYRRLLRFCKENNLTERVQFTGFLDRGQLEQLYLRAKIMVFPSTSKETYGFSGAEAVSYGIPVVAFNIAGISEWLIDGQTGIMVPNGNDIALAGAIRLLLTDDRVYQRYKNNCIAWSEHLDYEKQLKTLSDYYNILLYPN